MLERGKELLLSSGEWVRGGLRFSLFWLYEKVEPCPKFTASQLIFYVKTNIEADQLLTLDGNKYVFLNL